MNILEADHFDTHICISADCSEALLTKADELCISYENKFSKFIHGSEVWMLNHGADLKDVSKETADLVAFAEKLKTDTGGMYDIKWCGEYDLGSIAKGYIADRIAELLKAGGCGCALINLGGNILTVGGRPDGSDWVIGLQVPAVDRSRRSEYFAVVRSRDNSVVTSGNYERGHLNNGCWEGHIVDARTFESPSGSVLSATVIAGDSLTADALSTPLFILGPEKSRPLIAEYGISAVFCMSDGSVMTFDMGKHGFKLT